MIEKQLQDYTIGHKDEALLVTIEVGAEEHQILIFRGFTSALTYATPANPEDPVIPPGAVLKTIDRVKAPFHPSNPHYIHRGLSWSDFQALL